MRLATGVLGLLMTAGAWGQPMDVRIERTGDGFRLTRNGVPYFIKGASGTNLYLDRLVAAGGNSIRGGPDVLERARALGLSVLVVLPLGKPRNGFDYNDARQVARQAAAARETVLKFKDHPALLMWSLDNELELDSNPLQRPAMWKEIDKLAAMIHQVDGKHPVITSIADRRTLPELGRVCPALDAVGVNAYVDMLTLADDLEKYGWRRPYLVTGFGPRGHWEAPLTSWRVPIEDSSTEKADLYAKGYTRAVEGRPACLGAYAFDWGFHHEKTHTWYGMFLPNGSATAAVEVMSYFWTGKWPPVRAPRIGPAKIVVRQVGASNPPAHIYAPGVRLLCSVQITDPDSAALAVHWDVRPDVSANLSRGGGPEPPAEPIAGAVLSDRNPAMIQLPKTPGNYRIFVYVSNPKGTGATASVPVMVK